MKRLLTLVAFFATVQASAQQVNPVPDYVFRNQMSVGRGMVTDTAAYFSIGPRYGATKGFMPPIVGDTATFSSGKRNGLLIFSVQKNKFLYWDSVRVQWSDMAGSSGSYITGSGITGYLPQFSASTTLDTSALFTLGNRLGIGTSTFAYNSTNTANMELNGTAGGILGFKRNDSARGYLWHTGDNMELANTAAGSIFFNTNSATRGSISSAGVWRLHNLAGTGDRVVQASSNGTLSASTSVTGLVDTTTISTRAWRKKGDDSLGAIIATKGSGTVTSVATGYGLSGGTITTTGTLLVDTLNIATRAWRQKGLDSLAALEVSGSGTTNYIPKFTASGTIGNSQIFDNGTSVGIGTASPIGGILDVATSATAVTRIRSTNASNGAYLLFQNGTTGTGGSNGYLIGTDNSLSYVWNYESKPISFATNATERLRITSGGDVGIGTSSPYSVTNYKFLTLNDVTGSGVQFRAAGSIVGELFATASNTLLIAGGGGFFGAYTGGSERLRIFANGRVGVNTTTDAGYQLDINGTLRSVNGANFATTSGNVGVGTASPSGKLTVVGANTNTYISIDNAGSGENYYASNSFQQWQTAGSARMTLNSAGELLINTTSDAGDYKLQVSGNIYNTGSAVLAATSGNVGVGSAPSAWTWKALQNGSFSMANVSNVGFLTANAFWDGAYKYINTGAAQALEINNGNEFRFLTAASGTSGSAITFTQAMTLNAASELLVNTTSDAGDYKLQVVGNARIGTGKLDIASNTTFGLGIARSGTSEVAGQIYNSNGILYLGAESSTGGQIFSGSSAYAGVIGTGANYPLQFATNNATRATINTNGELLINTTTDNGDFKLQVNGNALISGSIKTANGGSSTAVPWHLGSVVSSSVALNTGQYVEVEINGVFYRLAIVTPL